MFRLYQACFFLYIRICYSWCISLGSTSFLQWKQIDSDFMVAERQLKRNWSYNTSEYFICHLWIHCKCFNRELLGGIIPGILIGLSLMIVTYFYAKKRGYPQKEVHLKFNKVIFGLLIALMMPVIPSGIFVKFLPRQRQVLLQFFMLLLLEWAKKQLNFLI